MNVKTFETRQSLVYFSRVFLSYTPSISEPCFAFNVKHVIDKKMKMFEVRREGNNKLSFFMTTKHNI